MVSVLLIFTLAAAALHIAAAECSSAMDCSATEQTGASKGSAMLQVQGSAALQVRPQLHELRSPAAPSAQNVECSVKRAKEQPLTEEGFAEVSASCCFDDVKEFTRRLVDDMGYKVCDEGGLSGISPFYACPASPVTLATLKEELQDAVQTKSSKCHWLVDRFAECIPVAVQCQVAFYFPHPAPAPVAEGFVAFRATNPAEMVRSNKIIELVTEELALATAVETKYLNIVMATGTVDGEQSQSLLHVPKSQAFIRSSIKLSESPTCKVFALYSFQDKAPPAPKVLSESTIVDALRALNTTLLASRITQDLQKVDAGVGFVEVAETSVCAKTNGKCVHKVASAPAGE